MAHGENAARYATRKDLWKRRPMTSLCGCRSSKWSKTMCHRIERRLGRLELVELLEEVRS